MYLTVTKFVIFILHHGAVHRRFYLHNRYRHVKTWALVTKHILCRRSFEWMYHLGLVWVSDANCIILLNLVLLCFLPMWCLCSFAVCSIWTIAGNYIIAVHNLLCLPSVVVLSMFREACHVSHSTCDLPRFRAVADKEGLKPQRK